MKKLGMNDHFCVSGIIMRITNVEKGEVVVQEIKSGKKHIYGLEALKRICRARGMEIEL